METNRSTDIRQKLINFYTTSNTNRGQDPLTTSRTGSSLVMMDSDITIEANPVVKALMDEKITLPALASVRSRQKQKILDWATLTIFAAGIPLTFLSLLSGNLITSMLTGLASVMLILTMRTFQKRLEKHEYFTAHPKSITAPTLRDLICYSPSFFLDPEICNPQVIETVSRQTTNYHMTIDSPTPLFPTISIALKPDSPGTETSLTIAQRMGGEVYQLIQTAATYFQKTLSPAPQPSIHSGEETWTSSHAIILSPEMENSNE
jgi:Fe-S-cluster formation regulator IscX/YfhJ